MNAVHVLKQRPLCVFSCMLIILLSAAGMLGIRDDVTEARYFLQRQFPETTESNSGKEYAVAGRISRISCTDEKTSLRLKEIRLLQTDSGSTYDGASRDRTSDTAVMETADDKPGDRYCVQVTAKGVYPDLAVGNWVYVTGKVRYPAEPTCPGQYNNLLYADLNRILFSMVNARISRYAADRNTGTLADQIRRCLSDAFHRVLSEEDAGTMISITLGDKTLLPKERKDLFRDGGISHILAISGLHINLIGMSIYKLLRKRRAGFAFSGFVSGGLLLFYCFMTGMSRSAVRAGVMFILWVGSQVAGRTADTLTSLAAACCVLLLLSPASIRDGGFQMSFGCILSIYLLTPLTRDLLHYKDTGKLKDNMVSMLASSLAVSIGTLPICCRQYYQCSLYAPLLNLMVLPAMSALVLSGFAGACVGMLFPEAGIWTAAPCHYLLLYFTDLCRWESRLPGAVIVTGCPRIPQVMVYYAVLALILFINNNLRHKRKHPALPVCTLLAAAIFLLCVQITPVIRVIFLDVGQGDCEIIQYGRKGILVDGGSSSVEGVWEYRIQPCLKYYGIRKIEGWYATHGDLDHISGIEDCAAEYRINITGGSCGGITINRFCVSSAGKEDEILQQLCSLWQDRGVEISIMNPGSRLWAENFSLTTLYPSEDEIGESGNENSLVLLLEAGSGSTAEMDEESDSGTAGGPLRILLTGDLEKEGEEVFRESRKNIGKVHILKLGHHGSRYATSDAFLDTFHPDTAIASCGMQNRYGHPSPYTLERLERAGTEVLRTDLHGSIVYELWWKKWRRRQSVLVPECMSILK